MSFFPDGMEWNYKNPVFPKGTRLSELFTVTGKTDIKPEKVHLIPRHKTVNKLVLSGSMTIEKNGNYFTSVNIIPTSKLLQAIDSNMLKIDYDVIYLEIGIVPRSKGKLMLCAKYNQILGNRCLGYFSKSQLKEWLK